MKTIINIHILIINLIILVIAQSSYTTRNVQCSVIPYYRLTERGFNVTTYPEQKGFFYDSLTRQCTEIIKPAGYKITQNFFQNATECKDYCPSGTITLGDANLNPYEDCFNDPIIGQKPQVKCGFQFIGYFFLSTLGKCLPIIYSCSSIPSNNLFESLSICEQFCNFRLNSMYATATTSSLSSFMESSFLGSKLQH